MTQDEGSGTRVEFYERNEIVNEKRDVLGNL